MPLPLPLCLASRRSRLMTTKNSTTHSIPNPNSNSMQALHFIQALVRIRRAAPKPTTRSCRTKQIRRAAYACMASTTGSRRMWSRVLLRRLRQQQQQHSGRLLTVRRRIRIVTPGSSHPDEPTRADVLRHLVPGGKCMEYCNLLEEAADYVQCLRAQVQLMQSIVDSFSS